MTSISNRYKFQISVQLPIHFRMSFCNKSKSRFNLAVKNYFRIIPLIHVQVFQMHYSLIDPMKTIRAVLKLGLHFYRNTYHPQVANVTKSNKLMNQATHRINEHAHIQPKMKMYFHTIISNFEKMKK